MLEVYLKELAKASSILDQVRDKQLESAIKALKDLLLQVKEAGGYLDSATDAYHELLRQRTRVEGVLIQAHIMSSIVQMLDETDYEWKLVSRSFTEREKSID